MQGLECCTSPGPLFRRFCAGTWIPGMCSNPTLDRVTTAVSALASLQCRNNNDVLEIVRLEITCLCSPSLQWSGLSRALILLFRFIAPTPCLYSFVGYRAQHGLRRSQSLQPCHHSPQQQQQQPRSLAPAHMGRYSLYPDRQRTVKTRITRPRDKQNKKHSAAQAVAKACGSGTKQPGSTKLQ